MFGKRDLDRRMSILEKQVFDLQRESRLNAGAAAMAASDASIARSIARDRSEEVNYLGKAVNEIQRRLTLAGTKGASLLTPGTRVRYYGIHGEGWTGIVCPRPSNLRQHGNTGERLVYVVSDNGRVYGCYPGNLVRL